MSSISCGTFESNPMHEESLIVKGTWENNTHICVDRIVAFIILGVQVLYAGFPLPNHTLERWQPVPDIKGLHTYVRFVNLHQSRPCHDFLL